jgi:mitochondrial chaperone BCS1
MTNNNVENLDKALLRPGRVDFEVAFSNATKFQIKELFEKMYKGNLVPQNLVSEFVEKVPGDIFSPAEIQGFLLNKKKDPRRAVEEVDAWVKMMVEKKNKR